MKKFTQEEVDEFLAIRGILMADKPYKGAGYKHTFICSNNHEWKTSYSSIKNHGTRCPQCSGVAKHSQDSVDTYLESRGIEMLDKPYKNTYSLHRFKCFEKGHEWSTSYRSIFHNGSGCIHCLYESQRVPINIIKEKLAAKGLNLVDDCEYTGIKGKQDIICKYGHIWNIDLDNIINNNSECPHCNNEGLQETKLYIMCSNVGIKIGISIKPEQRLVKVKNSGNLNDLMLYKIFDIDDYSLSRKLEKEAHTYFRDRNCNYKDFDGATEFFNITPQEAEEYINQLIKELSICH